MTHTTYFNQECPRCGRTLRIRVEYLGRSLTCQHCRGKLVASDPEQPAAAPTSSLELIQRANELLGQSQVL